MLTLVALDLNSGSIDEERSHFSAGRERYSQPLKVGLIHRVAGVRGWFIHLKNSSRD